MDVLKILTSGHSKGNYEVKKTKLFIFSRYCSCVSKVNVGRKKIY